MAAKDLHQIGGEKFGTVEDISLNEWTVDIKKRKDTAIVHPEAVFAHEVFRTEVLAEGEICGGEYVAIHGLVGEGPYQSARDLLLVAGSTY